jgi:broad specificity phosphatase PhoE
LNLLYSPHRFSVFPFHSILFELSALIVLAVRATTLEESSTIGEKMEDTKLQALALATGRPRLIVLIRHGESASNYARAGNAYVSDDDILSIAGVPDHEIPLTELGYHQAERTGFGIRDDYGHFDVCYHSNYLRTRETLSKILQAYPGSERQRMKIRGDDRLRERHPGYTFQMTQSQADKNFPYLKEYYEVNGYFYSVPPGGESQAQVCERLFIAIGRWFKIRAGAKLLVVAHAGSIRAIRYNLERWSGGDYLASLKNPGVNCGVWTYGFSAKTNRLELQRENRTY